jgi:hypothetical protein
MNTDQPRRRDETGAERSWRYRDRRRRRLIPVPLDVYESEVKMLVNIGFLASEDANDRWQIGKAVAKVLIRALPALLDGRLRRE